MSAYETGNHHQVTIVDEADTRPCALIGHDCARGHMVAVVTNGDAALAKRICALLNREDASDIVIAYPRTEGRGYPPVPDSCTCTKVGPDPACVVHEGRRAKGPHPGPVGPGCICDGSGRTCPRHGAVI